MVGGDDLHTAVRSVVCTLALLPIIVSDVIGILLVELKEVYNVVCRSVGTFGIKKHLLKF